MPSLGDSIFIFMLALMLFGPKKLPQLARQLGKLMAEFRRASNDFRMQMEDELRLEEQKEHQKKVDALAPPPSTLPNPDIPTEDPSHPHMPALIEATSVEATSVEPVAVQPIAESGELKMMPPSTGLPTESRARNRSVAGPETPGATMAQALPEPPAANDTFSLQAGMSSDEPSGMSEPDGNLFSPPAEIFEPAPDRRQPAMVGEGERTTHA